jgi:hypothetical protein
MILMLRALILATLVVVIPRALLPQSFPVLHIKVVLVDAQGQETPVARHGLLISDNPASTAPRLVVTGLDGTADVTLRPGNYTVESDRPVALDGKAYEWTEVVDVPAGRDAVLTLTAKNAAISVPSATTASAGSLAADPSFLLPRWQDSVVALWTPTAHGSGFFADARGLIVTNQRIVGTADAVEVEVGPRNKVPATVLVADSVRDVAVLWIDPKAIGATRPLPLDCGRSPGPAVTDGQELFTIGAPMGRQKDMEPGIVSRVDPHRIVSDVRLAPASAGGPVFTAAGDLVGLTSPMDDTDRSSREDARIVRTADACEAIASAEKKMNAGRPPDGTRLPLEPQRPYPVAALKQAAEGRGGSLSPYQLSASGFDVAFLTPVLTYGAQYQAEQISKRSRNTNAPRSAPEPALVRPLLDFGNWSDYVDAFPPVLLVRVTPKLVEGFWTTVARGAARTQGISIPPIKRFTSGFSRLRAFCGQTEVVPIHPFKIEQRLSETDAIYEGLYVFDPGALGPSCGTAKLVLYSEKAPDKGDTRIIDPAILQQIWQDFAPYRALTPQPDARE